MRSTLHLPAPVSAQLRRIGAGIQTARLRRNMSQEELAERIGVSFHTVRHMEKGKPGTAIGTYAHALWVLGILDTLSSAADPALDEEGLTLAEREMRKRGGHESHGISNEF
jgi:transcriptional regulator with XRE-family HTH domain